VLVTGDQSWSAEGAFALRERARRRQAGLAQGDIPGAARVLPGRGDSGGSGGTEEVRLLTALVRVIGVLDVDSDLDSLEGSSLNGLRDGGALSARIPHWRTIAPRQEADRGTRKCYKCGLQGHYRADCPAP
jgi:hypothetical protein